MNTKPKCPNCGSRRYVRGHQEANFYESEIIRVTTMLCPECGQTWGFYENFVVSSTWNEEVEKND